jgi:hypothetical protein
MSVAKVSYADLVLRKMVVDSKGEGFFRAVNDMVVTDDKIFLADFFSNEVFCYRFKGDNLEYLRSIGNPGQGPGDIQKPLALSAHEGRIAIQDQESLSVFSIDGKFISKFKPLSFFMGLVLGHDRVYYLSSNLSERYLVSSYSFNGKRLSDMMEKKLRFKAGEPDSIEHFRERLVYNGQLWLDDDHLYFISRYFGHLEKYSLSGELLLRNDLSGSLGDNAKRKSEINRRELIESAELKSVKGKFQCVELFLDSYFDGEYLYLLMSQHDVLNNKPINEIDIRRIRSSDLCPTSSYSIRLGEKQWGSNLCIRTVDDEPVFVVDLNTSEGQELYEIRKGK